MSREASKRALLQAAAKDEALRAEVPPVVAAGFGVLPLRRLGDVLTVACFPHANRRALRVLRDVLGVEIVASPFDERLLHEAIREAYFPQSESVNLPTFLSEDFLEGAGAAQALLVEKVEQVPQAPWEVEATQVVLVELTYRSVLTNLDRERGGGGLPDPARTRLILGDLDLAWQRVEGRPQALTPPGPQLRALLNEYRFTDYQRGHGATRVGEHLVRASKVDTLPHVVHATEVQLVGAEADGTLLWHVYDRLERVQPGAPRRLSVTYHFLSYGNRLRRRIEVEVHQVLLAAREALAGTGGAPWSGHELSRWLDVTPAGSMG